MVRLIVTGLPHDTTEFDVRDLFEEIGQILGLDMPGNHHAGQPEQTAYIDVASENQAADVIRHMNNRDFRGHRLVVERA